MSTEMDLGLLWALLMLIKLYVVH